MSWTFESIAQQGWQCPVCHRVYSPTTPMCWYCGGKDLKEITTVTTTTTTYSGEIESENDD